MSAPLVLRNRIFTDYLLWNPVADPADLFGRRVVYRPADGGFTSVSATCVTGLVVTDTATHFSLFGQFVILCLIQIGGLGFMSMSVLISALIRRAITPKEKVLIAQSMGMRESGGTVFFMRRILIATFAFEGMGRRPADPALCRALWPFGAAFAAGFSFRFPPSAMRASTRSAPRRVRISPSPPFHTTRSS